MLKPTISLCMVVKDEEKLLEGCLNTVANAVDEIIIVDTGSTDKTIEIVKNFGKAKIFHFKWIDDFSAARNESLRHAAKDWILVLDADEVIDENGKNQIGELVKNEDYDAYMMPQKNYTNDGGFYISLICRLFRNSKGYKFSGEVHELVEPSIKEKNGKLAVWDVTIHHYGNSNPEIAKKKKEYYLKLAIKKSKSAPSAASYYELGVLFKENDMPKEAEESLEKALSINPNHALALYELGVVKEKNNEIDKAIDYYTKSLREKEDAEAFFSLGSCYLKKGMLKEAYRNLIKSLVLSPNKYQTYNNLGAIHEKNSNFNEAIKVLEIGIKLNPYNAIGFYNLGVVYDKTGNKEKALECFEKAFELGHKNKELIGKKIKELKIAIENDYGYTYSFDLKDK